MARYIDADKLIQALCNTQKTWGSRLGTSWWSHSVKLKDNMVRCIKEQPTADVEEVKHGTLEVNLIKPWSGEVVNWKCSVCNGVTYYGNYCLHCGAKMDGGKTE